MATLRQRFVNTASVGGDGTTNATSGANAAYASLSAAEAGEQGNLVTADEYLVINCSGTAADTTAVFWDGYTTDATRYIEIIGDNVGAVWDDTKYRLEASASGSVGLFRILDDYVKVRNLQVYNTNPSPAGLDSAIQWFNGGTEVDSCITRGGSYTLVDVSTSACYLYNSISYGGSAGSVVTTNATPALSAWGCILVSDGPYGARRSTGTLDLKNCYAAGATEAYSQATSITTCASNDTTGSAGLINLAADNILFSDASSGDFRPSTGSALLSAGTDMSGDAAPLNLTVDIIDATRSVTPTIGATKDPAPPVPSFTDINGNNIIVVGSTGNIINGAVLGGVTAVSLDSGVITQALTNLTLTSTTITVNDAVVQGDIPYGTVTLTITDGSNPYTGDITLNPVSGKAYQTVGSSPDTTDASIFYTFVGGSPASGDQVEYDTANGLIINDDGTFEILPGAYTLNLRYWDTNSWAAFTVTVVDGRVLQREVEQVTFQIATGYGGRKSWNPTSK